MKSVALLAALAAGPVISSPALAQQAVHVAPAIQAPANPMPAVSPRLTTVPDSIRQRVGYQHWKGGAIGGGLGALGGLLLAVAAHGQCDDCTSDTAPVGKVTLIGAALGGAFGFLVGAASPRYRWVRQGAE